MKLKKRKIFFSWQFEEQERWINEMSENGWQLEYFGEFTYEFQQSEPGEYIYRLQLIGNTQDDISDYIRFVEQTGAEVVCRNGNHFCFRKKASEGPFELVSDAENRIKFLRSRMAATGTSGGMLLSSVIINLHLVITEQLFFNLTLKIITLLACTSGAFSIWSCAVFLLKYLKLKKQHNLYE